MSRNYSVVLSAAIFAAVAVSFAFANGGLPQTVPTTGAATGAAPDAGAGGGRGGRGAGRGVQQPPPASEGVMLPESAPADGRPQINGPRITGATPGRPFMFHVPVTGNDVTITIDGLPDGLTLDAKTGMITGSLKAPLAKAVTIHAKNAKGEATRQFVIVGGTHKLALTPPLGWNSWNCYGGSVSQALMQAAADAMVKSGLSSHGFEYVNLDDGWAPRPGPAARNAEGVIQPNDKFPNMKALSDYVHSKGLKLGIYSSPGPKTCEGYLGSYGHEEQDAKTFAEWGIDYLKYDWCSAPQVYENNKETMAAAYAKMGLALLNSGRKIVYSLCQYGNFDVGEWGEMVGGNLWRTTGDIADRWTSMENIGFKQQLGREKVAGAGHWNDPDMLEIGNGGMTDTEYETHMSLWSLLAAPLLAGNDIRDMKPSIAAILMNKEVIAIDQDKLGKQGVRVSQAGDVEVWAKPLADGGVAVGLFNRGADTAKVTAKWSDLGIKGPRRGRDLWKHTDLGKLEGDYTADVPSHGVVMLRLSK